MAVHRTLKQIYVQVIDDVKGATLAAASSNDKELRSSLKSGANIEAARQVGELVAKRALEAGVKDVIFDRGGFIYHGRVKALAEEIVVAQDREIAEMRFLLADIEANGEAGPEWPLGKSDGPASVASLTQAISTPVIAGIRPAPLSDAEIESGLGTEPMCTFVRAVNADPILATDGNGQGIAKVSGSLVQFEATGSVAPGGVLMADGGQMTVAMSDADNGEGSTLLFELTGETPLAVAALRRRKK